MTKVFRIPIFNETPPFAAPMGTLEPDIIQSATHYYGNIRPVGTSANVRFICSSLEISETGRETIAFQRPVS